jgi:hypothetical protein
MINVDDYMILWCEGGVSFVHYIMATCAAQGSMGKKKKKFVYPASAHNKENVQCGS